MSRPRGAEVLLRKALAGLDLLEDGERRFEAEREKKRRSQPGYSFTPEELDLHARKTVEGKRAVEDIQAGHDQARTYGTVAIALLLDEFLGAGEPR